MNNDPLEPNNTPNNAPSGAPATPATPAPAATPAASPAATPAASPAPSPATSPTASPAASPVASPTEAPAETPTAAPTEAPTAAPTNAPTNNPPEAHKKPITLICIIATLCAALIATVVVLVISLNPGNNNANKQSAETTQNDDYKDKQDYDINDDDNDLDDGSGTAGSGGNANLTNNWQDYSFSVNGQTLSLPLSYQSLSTASGFTMKEADAGSTIASNYYTLANLYQDGKLALYTEVANNSNDYLKLSDCEVTRISQTSHMIQNGAAIVTFPGNLYIGMAMDEATLTGILGAPNESKDYSGTKEIRYFANPSWTTANYYRITIKDGVIDEITLDNR